MNRDAADIDPVETREWLDSLDGVIEVEGQDRAAFLLELAPGGVGWTRVDRHRVLAQDLPHHVEVMDRHVVDQRVLQRVVLVPCLRSPV